MSRPAWLNSLRHLRRHDFAGLGDLPTRLQCELAHAVITLIGGSTRLRIVHPETLRWGMAKERGTLFVGWHANTAVPVNFFRNQGVYALISQSRDGNLQAAIFQRFGWQVFRGSSGQGGSSAVREAARILRRGGKIGLTPDGPRGPREHVQPGAAMMQRLANCPVIAVGVGFAAKRRLATWDRYQVPCPGSRSVLYFDAPLLPERLRSLDLEQTRQLIEDRLSFACACAESIAAGRGERYVNCSTMPPRV